MSDMKNPLFYKYCRTYDFNKAIRSAFEKGIITNTDKAYILEYIHERKALGNLTDIRCNKIASCLVNFRRFLDVEYSQCLISDIFSAVNSLQSGLSTRGKPLKQNTKRDYIIIVKPFLIWLHDNEYNCLPVKKIRMIKSPPADRMTTKPDEILTPDEIRAMIDCCQNSRDRALISVLYESGVRVGELGRFTWQDVIFDEFGARLYIDDQKTDKIRYSRLTFSTESLATWKNNYPEKPANDLPVFIDLHKHSAMRYDAIFRVVQRLGKRAGIKKRITPHLFRHSRITHLIQQNYQESIIKKSMWGNLDTDMFSTYVSLSESDIDHEFLSKAGIEEKKNPKNNPLMAIPCGNCHHINDPRSEFCSKCGFPLTKEAECEVNDKIIKAMNYIESNPNFKEFYAEYQTFMDTKKQFQNSQEKNKLTI